MVYVLTNPVKPFLVKKHCRWPGLLGFRRSDSAEVVRPKVFFRPTGSAPQSAKLVFVPPPAWAHMAPKDFEHRVEQDVAAAEARYRAIAAKGGRGFLGEHALLRQKVTDSPLTAEPRQRLSPKIAAKDKWRRIEALKRLKEFVATYREAWEQWRKGKRRVLFPEGTYALRVYAGVCCHPT